MSRKRNRDTKPQGNDPFNPLGNTVKRTQSYFDHYYLNLTSIALEMFEWKGLPDSVDPGFLERVLISNGYCAFYRDPEIGYVVVKGTVSGKIDIHGLPMMFHAHSPNYNNTFKLYNYKDLKEKKMGVLIKNNELRTSLLPSLEMFASDLAEMKQIIRVNLKAQMTPKIFLANDRNILTMKNFAQQIDEGVVNIFMDEKIDPSQVVAHDNTAPYVADKINQMRDATWNEVMTFLGIKNANLQKKERMITDEVQSNDEQIQASGNVFLKTRKEAARMINDLYGLNVSVDYRASNQAKEKDGETNGGNDTAKENNRTTDTVRDRNQSEGKN